MGACSPRSRLSWPAQAPPRPSGNRCDISPILAARLSEIRQYSVRIWAFFAPMPLHAAVAVLSSRMKCVVASSFSSPSPFPHRPRVSCALYQHGTVPCFYLAISACGSVISSLFGLRLTHKFPISRCASDVHYLSLFLHRSSFGDCTLLSTLSGRGSIFLSQ